MDALIKIEHDGDWLVIVVERKRVRRFYLTITEAAELAALLGRELPEVTTRRTSLTR